MHAKEGPKQIARYSSIASYVVYLTPWNYPEPNLRIKKHKNITYVHIHWDDVRDIVIKSGLKNMVLDQFVEYLDSSEVIALKPLSTEEINHATLAFNFIEKGEEIVRTVRDNIKKELPKILGRKYWQGKGGYSNRDNSINYFYRIRKWKKTRVAIEMGIASGEGVANCDSKSAYYFVSFNIEKKPFIATMLEPHKPFQKSLAILKKKKWKKWGSEFEYGYYKRYAIRAGSVDKISKELYDNTMEAINELKSSHMIKVINTQSRGWKE
jgi:hypothetical protein